jgi:hypothetical protein
LKNIVLSVRWFVIQLSSFHFGDLLDTSNFLVSLEGSLTGVDLAGDPENNDCFFRYPLSVLKLLLLIL